MAKRRKKRKRPGERPRLFDKYRPQTFDEVVGQEELVRRIRQIAERGLAGRAYWISGRSGQGKTTLARLIAREIASPVAIEERDAGELESAQLDRIERVMWLRGLGAKPGRAYIVNEAHGLHKWELRRLLTTLEALPPHVAFIFTTTNLGQQGLFEAQIDAGPLLSRCYALPLKAHGLTAPFARRAKEIAGAEQLDGEPLEAYMALAERCDSNLRTMLQAVEAGEMRGRNQP